MPDVQFGFRKNHSATLQLLRIKKHIKLNLNKKNSTGMVMLDIQRAFDSVWHNGLIYKLIQLNFPLHLIKILSSFLKNRTFKVKVQDKLSATHIIPYGVPQGSVLSPILYNLFIHDLPITNCELALFADDTAIFTSSRFSKAIEKKLSSDVNKLNRFYNKWKIKLNNEKTEAIFFTLRRHKQIPSKFLKTKYGKIKFKSEVRYLGVLFNKKLKFNLHIANQIKRVDSIFKILYPILNRRSTLDPIIKINIYKLFLRSVLIYASSVFLDSPVSVLRPLQTKQNKILKCILGLPWFTRTTVVHNISNVNYILDQMIKKKKKKIIPFNSCKEHGGSQPQPTGFATFR